MTKISLMGMIVGGDERPPGAIPPKERQDGAWKHGRVRKKGEHGIINGFRTWIAVWVME